MTRTSQPRRPSAPLRALRAIALALLLTLGLLGTATPQAHAISYWNTVGSVEFCGPSRLHGANGFPNVYIQDCVRLRTTSTRAYLYSVAIVSNYSGKTIRFRGSAGVAYTRSDTCAETTLATGQRRECAVLGHTMIRDSRGIRMCDALNGWASIAVRNINGSWPSRYVESRPYYHPSYYCGS